MLYLSFFILYDIIILVARVASHISVEVVPGCVSQWHLSNLAGAFFIIVKEVFLMTVLYSYTPEEVEKFKAQLKQAEERAAFFEKAWILEHDEVNNLKQQLGIE